MVYLEALNGSTYAEEERALTVHRTAFEAAYRRKARLPMSKIEHPLKGEFDTETARWERTTDADGNPASLEIGYAANGMVALRKADDPDGDLLIYTPAEWEAFKEGVSLGEFDPGTWNDEQDKD